MKTKNLLPLVLSLTLTVGLLVSCSKQRTNNTNPYFGNGFTDTGVMSTGNWVGYNIPDGQMSKLCGYIFNSPGYNDFHLLRIRDKDGREHAVYFRLNQFVPVQYGIQPFGPQMSLADMLILLYQRSLLFRSEMDEAMAVNPTRKVCVKGMTVTNQIVPPSSIQPSIWGLTQFLQGIFGQAIRNLITNTEAGSDPKFLALSISLREP